VDNVWTRDFGQARLSVISEATGWWPRERAVVDVPEAAWRREVPTDHEDRLEIGFNLAHVAVPGASILMDTGFGEYDPTNRTDPIVSVRDVRLTDGLDAALGILGIDRADITHVLISHMHGDHILGATRTIDGRRVPAFPNARFAVMESEWEAAPEFHQNAAAVNAQKEALLAADVVDLVDGEREIVSGIRFIPAPGESRGHAIVRVELGGRPVYYVGDLFHYPAEISHLDWIPLFRDRPTLVSTREHLVPRFARENAWIVPSHHPFPAIGRVEAASDGYHWHAWKGD
jgi:glyoxylase-like metal-dependent hydrolase (beta-lactamase superfamily II)